MKSISRLYHFLILAFAVILVIPGPTKASEPDGTLVIVSSDTLAINAPVTVSISDAGLNALIYSLQADVNETIVFTDVLLSGIIITPNAFLKYRYLCYEGMRVKRPPKLNSKGTLTRSEFHRAG